MGVFNLAKLFGMTIRESANDGSDFTNPDADYRRLFLGEDGQLHVKDSAGAVTDIGGAVADILDLPTAETDTTLVLAPDGAGGVEFRAETGGGGSTGARYPVQEAVFASASTNSANQSVGTTPTNGNLMVLVSANEGAFNITGITQTNVTWSKVAESTASTAPHCEIWKGVVSGSAGTSITVAYSGTTFTTWLVQEWSGVTGTLDQSATATTVTSKYIPLITPTVSTALVISGGTESTFAADFSALYSPQLMPAAARVSSSTNVAFGWGFPGTNPVLAAWVNTHGGTSSFVTVSLT